MVSCGYGVCAEGRQHSLAGILSKKLGNWKRRSDPHLLHPSNIALRPPLCFFVELVMSFLLAEQQPFLMLWEVYGLFAMCHLCPVAGGFRHSANETEILFTDCFANREPALISLAGSGWGGSLTSGVHFRPCLCSTCVLICVVDPDWQWMMAGSRI